MITKVNEALNLLRKQKIITLTHSKSFFSLIDEIVGHPIKGSWWGHEKGNLIFLVSSGLADSSEVLTVKLVNSKTTYVHQDLWPALYRIVTDTEWRKLRISRLKPISLEILNELEIRGKLRIDELIEDWGLKIKSGKKEITKARIELETSLLVFAQQIHTEKGYHATEIMRWEFWTWGETKNKADEMSMDEAVDQIKQYCNGYKLSIF